MSRRTLTLVAALIAAGALSATGLASVAAHKPKAGRYAGTTSEHGTVALKVAKSLKQVTGFATTDGYNAVCKFSGGVGGIPTYTVKLSSMSLRKSGAFSGTVKATVGPFSGTFAVKGKVTGGTARGTVTEVGSTCGSGSPTPTAADYLETFTATRA